MLEHALLMLSSGVEPDPVEEIRWHAARCATPRDVTAVAITRNPRQLSSGYSKVAFYGDASLDNRLLGTGTFVGFEPIPGREGEKRLAESDLYAGGARPAKVKGMLLLRDVREAPAGTSIASLDGILSTSGEPLRPDSLPRSAARSLLYFRRAGG